MMVRVTEAEEARREREGVNSNDLEEMESKRFESELEEEEDVTSQLIAAAIAT